MVTLKICGLSDADCLATALEAGADMVGFVFFEASPRHVTLERAQALGAQAAGRARKVALTVDAEDAELAAIVEALEPDILQLHGSESPERIAYVRARFGLPVMRAISVASEADLGPVAAYDAIADYLLFDARPPRGARRPGGNGESFDWSLLRGIAAHKPWFLAGGLNSGNVHRAMRATSPFGLDVSSGVETAPGVKDPALITRFITDARRAAETLGTRRAIG